jgi:hypothetical protein
MRRRWIKRWICSLVIAALVGMTSAPVLAETESVARSVLVPGTGQAHEGHYGKAAIFAGAAVVTGVGWILSQVHYNQSVRRYNNLRGLYVAYPDQLQSGEVIPYSEIQQTFDDMQKAWDTSEDRKVWRNVFMTAFIVTYAVNLIDVIISKPETGELPDESATSAVGFELQGDNVRVYKSFSF